MDLFLNIIKGFLVGVAASIPVGPVAILVIQKSLSKGYKAGFVTGLGASVVDTLFAVIAVFALAFTQKFLSDHEVVILLAGGVILIGLGLAMTLKNPFRKQKRSSPCWTQHFKQMAWSPCWPGISGWSMPVPCAASR